MFHSLKRFGNLRRRTTSCWRRRRFSGGHEVLGQHLIIALHVTILIPR
jgi:hypothetical protein